MQKFCKHCYETSENKNHEERIKPYGYIEDFYLESDDDNICPICENKLMPSLLDDDEFEILCKYSNYNSSFIKSMDDLKRDNIIEFESHMLQFREVQESNNPKEDNTLRCPTCNSTKVKKISATSKVIGASMFGLFSKTARSQFKCEQCGYKW